MSEINVDLTSATCGDGGSIHDSASGIGCSAGRDRKGRSVNSLADGLSISFRDALDDGFHEIRASSLVKPAGISTQVVAFGAGSIHHYCPGWACSDPNPIVRSSFCSVWLIQQGLAHENVRVIPIDRSSECGNDNTV